MKKNKGFTLIELLVVIAIIGILASVVLASLSSARNKGKDAAVKSQLANMRAQAELYYSTNENFYTSAIKNVCVDASTVNGFGGTGGLLVAIKNSEGVESTINTDPTVAGTTSLITCNSTATGTGTSTDQWAVEAPLTDSSTPMYCVDSTGASRGEAAPMVAGATACL
jgi:prepilin-type N-terminal cleavage/methylation domain-containing protein